MSNYQKINYTGKLHKYQLYGSNYQKIEYERDPFNAYQNFLYKRALFGLSVYTDDELCKMHWDKKKRIDKVHKRAQDILNLWKQELANQWCCQLLSKFFWHSTLVKDYSEKFVSETDTDYISTLEFKDLGVSKKQIVDRLISTKVLPINFYELEKA